MGFNSCMIKVNRNYSILSPCLKFFIVTNDASGLLLNVPKEFLPSFPHVNE